MNNPFRNLVFIAWIGLALTQVIDLVSVYISVGNLAFNDYSYTFNCILVVLMILMIVFMFVGNVKAFVILFSIYALTEAAFAIADSSFTLTNFRLEHVIELYPDKPQFPIFYIANYFIYPAVMTLYAGLFATSLVMRLTNRRKTNFFVNRTIDLGYAVAVVNVVMVILSFTIQTGGFDFLTILLNLFAAVFFSLIYISLPRYLYR